MDERGRLIHDLFTRMLFEFIGHAPVHDEPYRGVWFCAECPYSNVGSRCTKCGAWIGQSSGLRDP